MFQNRPRIDLNGIETGINRIHDGWSCVPDSGATESFVFAMFVRSM